MWSLVLWACFLPSITEGFYGSDYDYGGEPVRSTRGRERRAIDRQRRQTYDRRRDDYQYPRKDDYANVKKSIPTEFLYRRFIDDSYGYNGPSYNDYEPRMAAPSYNDPPPPSYPVPPPPSYPVSPTAPPRPFLPPTAAPYVAPPPAAAPYFALPPAAAPYVAPPLTAAPYVTPPTTASPPLCVHPPTTYAPAAYVAPPAAYVAPPAAYVAPPTTYTAPPAPYPEVLISGNTPTYNSGAVPVSNNGYPYYISGNRYSGAGDQGQSYWPKVDGFEKAVRDDYAKVVKFRYSEFL